MPGFTAADTISILVATDNHVGCWERDAVRGDDSWRSFHEIMCLAKERDVDMVLLAGDLFHENKPSRKSMHHVMRTLRQNCMGDKPCELEMLSDNSEVFGGAFNYVNYEDPDMNIAIPVFSIHGNHDDPSGEGHLAALDILQTAGLVNYYGRTPEADKIHIKPVLLQKGRTKLALYGMSNVRDERLFRTFRDHKVKFFQPSRQKSDWFNLMSVHQNHHAYTDTGYLPENFLPDFLDLVVWGHEHECLIEPTFNPETNFHVMQPGSSVATSLCPGEAVPKCVSILKIQGKDFKSESVRLKTVRPFVMREISLQEDKEMKKISKRADNRTDITRHLERIVYEMIDEANNEWEEAIGDEREEDQQPPLPLIRLRVEHTPPDGGNYDLENPQRFSARFQGKVANTQDVVQYHRRKVGANKLKPIGGAEVPDDAALANSFALDITKVEKLVQEFLDNQSLTIFPQNSFSDAVNQFVDKDDKHSMDSFVETSLESQINALNTMQDYTYGDDLAEALLERKSFLEQMFAEKGISNGRVTRKPKPDNYDSDLEGHWVDNPNAMIHSDEEEAQNSDDTIGNAPAKGRGRAPAGAKKAAPAKKAPAKPAARGKKKVIEEDSEDDDIVMVNASDDDSESQLFLEPEPPKRGRKAAAAAPPNAPAKRAPARAAKAATARQAQLSFGTSQPKTQTKAQVQVIDDISDDDDDDFAPAFSAAKPGRSR